MELRVLRYFLMVAREENITHAAQLLHVTQPTLSRQIQDLEEELGTKLFVRSNHRIVLTQEGMLLRRRAQEIVDLADKTERELLDAGQRLKSDETLLKAEFETITQTLLSWTSEMVQKYSKQVGKYI